MKKARQCVSILDIFALFSFPFIIFMHPIPINIYNKPGRNIIRMDFGEVYSKRFNRSGEYGSEMRGIDIVILFQIRKCENKMACFITFFLCVTKAKGVVSQHTILSHHMSHDMTRDMLRVWGGYHTKHFLPFLDAP